MKNIPIILALVLLLSCNRQENAPSPKDIHINEVKITITSNKIPYVYRRSDKYNVWSETECTTNTSVFYEVPPASLDSVIGMYGNRYSDMQFYATLAKNYTSGDIISIKAEYQGKSVFKESANGLKFANIQLKDLI